jgi:hypothetical protein
MKKEESAFKKRLYTAVILLVLGSSIIGFVFSAIPNLNLQNEITRNGVKFTPTQQGYSAIIGGTLFEFGNLPEAVNSQDTGPLDTALRSRVVYFTSAPDTPYSPDISGAQFDLSRALTQERSTFAEIAFTGANSFGKEVITCENATQFIPVVFFNQTNSTTEVREDGNCIIINFVSTAGLQRVADSAVYRILGVIPNE